MPEVSVIIPCYNQGVYIEEAINSVLAQTFTDLEIIVVNDGSNDGHTLSVLNALQTPKTRVFHTNNKGVSAARNYGIAQSSGQFILPLDADDWIDSKFLSASVPLLKQNSLLEIVGTGARYFGEISTTELLPDYSPRRHLLQNLFFNTSLFRRSGFEKINGYDESLQDGWEDWDMFLRLIDQPQQVYMIKEFLLHYRIKALSRNAGLITEKKQRVEQQLFLKHIDKYMRHFPEPIQALRNSESLQQQVDNFEQYKVELAGSLSYRLGHFILSPVKWISKIGKAAK
ncbi:MAG: glycosyltransferase family A protein [Ferruginibacter sp.]